MLQHKASCARKYWQRIQQHARPDDDAGVTRRKSRPCYLQSRPPDPVREDVLQVQNVGMSEGDKGHTLRIFHENTFDLGLAADAIPTALRHFEETEDIESYKAALVTALCFNITINDVIRRHYNRLESFYLLADLALAVDQLVRGGRQINDAIDGGGTILHIACASGVSDLLEPLFWRGALFDTVDEFDGTALTSAVKSGDMSTVRFALALGSDPNLGHPLIAAVDGRHDIIALLVEHGADINQTFTGITPLTSAIVSSDLDTVRFLHSLGADLNIAHPLGFAIEGCLCRNCDGCAHEEIICFLVEQGADISIQSGQGSTVLHYAAHKGHVPLLHAALERNTFPGIHHLKDCSGDTALHCVARVSPKAPVHRNLAVVPLLLEAGADIDVQDACGDSALMLAASRGNDQLVRLLLDAGASVNIANRYGQSALSNAAQVGCYTMVRSLLEKAPPMHADYPYFTHALETAIKHYCEGTSSCLHCVREEPSAEGETARARRSLPSKILRTLLDAGARFNWVEWDSIGELFRANAPRSYSFGVSEDFRNKLIHDIPELRAHYA